MPGTTFRDGRNLRSVLHIQENVARALAPVVRKISGLRLELRKDRLDRRAELSGLRGRIPRLHGNVDLQQYPHTSPLSFGCCKRPAQRRLNRQRRSHHQSPTRMAMRRRQPQLQLFYVRLRLLHGKVRLLPAVTQMIDEEPGWEEADEPERGIQGNRQVGRRAPTRSVGRRAPPRGFSRKMAGLAAHAYMVHRRPTLPPHLLSAGRVIMAAKLRLGNAGKVKRLRHKPIPPK